MTFFPLHVRCFFKRAPAPPLRSSFLYNTCTWNMFRLRDQKSKGKIFSMTWNRYIFIFDTITNTNIFFMHWALLTLVNISQTDGFSTGQRKQRPEQPAGAFVRTRYLSWGGRGESIEAPRAGNGFPQLLYIACREALKRLMDRPALSALFDRVACILTSSSLFGSELQLYSCVVVVDRSSICAHYIASASYY